VGIISRRQAASYCGGPALRAAAEFSRQACCVNVFHEAFYAGAPLVSKWRRLKAPFRGFFETRKARGGGRSRGYGILVRSSRKEMIE
jgi:hypothetical protein